MLVQQRDSGLRLIPQHDHGLLCGELAHAWSASKTPLSASLVIACALHDLPWQHTDTTPRFNPATHQPHSFTDFPVEERLVLYSDGIDELARIHPYASILVSLHYTRFTRFQGVEPFQSNAQRQRMMLLQKLGYNNQDPHALQMIEAQLEHELKLLQLIDLISLYACLAPPGARPNSAPAWLLPDHTAQVPGGDHVALRWEDRNTLVLDPNPLCRPVRMHLPVLDLPETTFADADALNTAVTNASWSTWQVEIRGKSRV